jgi:disulfide bond formation protein DsbB
MLENIIFLLPYGVLISHAVFLIFFLSLIFRNDWGKNVALWLGKNALGLALFVSLLAVVGSLFYSEIVGFEACLLCWWQRVFLYPLVIIFGIAFWKKHTSAFLYAVPFALIAALIAIYHSFVQLGGTSLIPCTDLGGDCSRIYVLAFDYITIPTMSLTIAIYVLLLAWANKIYSAR